MVFRRNTHAFQVVVLLTTATTLFATSPHFECVCPDGSRKPFCLSTFLGSSSCCCQGACCSPSEPAAGNTPPACCCCKHNGESPRPTESSAVPNAPAGRPSAPGLHRTSC